MTYHRLATEANHVILLSYKLSMNIYRNKNMVAQNTDLIQICTDKSKLENERSSLEEEGKVKIIVEIMNMKLPFEQYG